MYQLPDGQACARLYVNRPLQPFAEAPPIAAFDFAIGGDTDNTYEPGGQAVYESDLNHNGRKESWMDMLYLPTLGRFEVWEEVGGKFPFLLYAVSQSELRTEFDLADSAKPDKDCGK